MTNLLNRKALCQCLAVALAILLAFALVPHLTLAYGDDVPADAAVLPADDVAAEDASADDAAGADDPTDDAAADEAPDASEGGDAGADAEPADPAGGSSSDEGDASDGSFDAEVADTASPIADDAASDAEALGDEAGDSVESQADGPRANQPNVTIAADTAASYVYDKAGTYTLTVNAGVTLTGTVYVTGGAVLNLEGSGTIDGNGAPTVVHVEGANSTLNVNKGGGRLAIIGGAGGTQLNDTRNFPGYYAGGGILVQRTNPSGTKDAGTPATLNLYNGNIQGNTAGSGGGIYIDRGCGFVMENGTVAGNTATKYEGGGIYTASPAGRIEAGAITGNETRTTTSWGGGGIFIESMGTLSLGTTLITGNTAQGLGGGVSGCPHAKIGIGKITEGAAIYGNKATKAARPDNKYLYDMTNNTAQPDRTGDIIAYTHDAAGFTAAKAMDFYCTKASIVFGQDSFETVSPVAWTGRVAKYGQMGQDVVINRGDTFAVSDASLGLTATAPVAPVQGRAVEISGNKSAVHGGGIGCNGTVYMGDLPSGERYGSFSFSFDKQLVSSLGHEFDSLGGRTFAFDLYDEAKNPLGLTAETDAADKVAFTVAAEDYLRAMVSNEERTLAFFVKEQASSYDDVSADPEFHKVEVRIKKVSEKATVNSVSLTTHLAAVQWVRFDGSEGDFSVANTLRVSGSWAPQATKFFYGAAAPGIPFSFTLQELRAEAVADTDAANLEGTLEGGASQNALTGDFSGSPLEASVAFDAIAYDEPGEHWYRITEDSGADPTVYVLKVEVAEGADHASLSATVAKVYYADSLESTVLHELTGDEAAVAFYNTDEDLGALAFSNYRVRAASGEPLERKCLVDPKIFKQLEGRTLRGGEFSFQLVRATDDYEPTSEVISETTNDQYGMVDFDAAANVAGEGEEPSCLLFTQPGTYRYRVIENTSFGRDPSIVYSGEVITFTAVVDEVDGALVATDMYYGRLVDGQNVRDENSVDPTWHPTITNQARPMDLAVRKTSELDRTQGLEGATYGLFMVNDNEQDDIFLGSAVSDADGWVYFEDVALAEGNRYYFKEQAAPAGHTVSEFRSSYFYVERDAAAEMGYVLRYADAATPWAAAAAEDAAVEDASGAEGDASPATSPATTGKDGAMLFVYERDGGVSDEATTVQFNKLDARTHEWVVGAELSVREKETGRVVVSWTSGAAPEVLQAVLNVDTVYVLREDAAPEGYELADDVEFSIDSYGNVAILAGSENGNAELADETLTLYDTRIPVEEVVTETRERVREVPGDGGTRAGEKLARTGDNLAWGAVALVAIGSAAVALAAGRRRKRGTHAK